MNWHQNFREVKKINAPNPLVSMGLIRSGRTFTLTSDVPTNEMASIRARVGPITNEQAIEWSSIWNKIKNY